MQHKIITGLIFLVVIIVSGTGGFFGKISGNAFSASVTSSSQQEVNERLIKGFVTAANILNQKCPIMIDKDTRLDRATVGPGPRTVYHHTFPRFSSRELDKNSIIASLKPQVKSNVCANQDMKKSLQYGGIYVYAYSSNDSIELGRIEIDRNDCGYPKISP